MQYYEQANNNGRTTKPISFKTRGGNINLHPLIIRLLNAGKTVLKRLWI